MVSMNRTQSRCAQPIIMNSTSFSAQECHNPSRSARSLSQILALSAEHGTSPCTPTYAAWAKPASVPISVTVCSWSSHEMFEIGRFLTTNGCLRSTDACS